MQRISIQIGWGLAGAVLASAGETVPTAQWSGPGARIEPLRAAPCEVFKNRLVLTGDWVDFSLGGERGQWRWMWDAFDGTSPDPNVGEPTDAAPGCRAALPAGGRWFYGDEFDAPIAASDIRYCVPGAECDGAFVTWFWGAGGAGTSEHCFIAQLTFETFDCAEGGSDPLGGVIYDLGDLSSSIGGHFYYMGADLSGGPLRQRLPADGFGGFQLILARAYDPDSGQLTLATLAQPMLWGTGDSESVPDGRVGSNGQSPGVECYSYSFGVCPDPMCPAVGFSARTDQPCPCVGDLVRDGRIDLGDLAILLSVFGRSGASIPNPCLDLDGNGVIDVQDLAQLLARFGMPC